MKALEIAKDYNFSYNEALLLPNSSEKPFNVLVVDDHHINQIIIKKILDLNGFSHKLANNGFEALNLIKKIILT